MQSQISVIYNDSTNQVGISAVVLSTQHDDGIDQEELKNDVYKNIIQPVIQIIYY